MLFWQLVTTGILLIYFMLFLFKKTKNVWKILRKTKVKREKKNVKKQNLGYVIVTTSDT